MAPADTRAHTRDGLSHIQLVVTRTATKSNKSQYYVNDRPSNFTDVTTLLQARGIDLDHKRFLILQGEVEAIAQMKPKAPSEHEDGLLEYLEDIIGTSSLKVRPTAVGSIHAKTQAARGGYTYIHIYICVCVCADDAPGGGPFAGAY
jgi:chromosome segregation ATPase